MHQQQTIILNRLCTIKIWEAILRFEAMPMPCKVITHIWDYELSYLFRAFLLLNQNPRQKFHVHLQNPEVSELDQESRKKIQENECRFRSGDQTKFKFRERRVTDRKERFRCEWLRRGFLAMHTHPSVSMCVPLSLSDAFSLSLPRL